jgi:hypothetical protein
VIEKESERQQKATTVMEVDDEVRRRRGGAKREERTRRAAQRELGLTRTRASWRARDGCRVLGGQACRQDKSRGGTQKGNNTRTPPDQPRRIDASNLGV